MNDTAITPMRFRYPLQRREPAAGFASRLAALNNRYMNEFLRDVLIHPREIDKGVEAKVRLLALIGGADPDQLVRFTPHPAERDRFHQVAGETLGHLGVNRTIFSFCPHCVLEDLNEFEGPVRARPWLRLQWTISHFRSCDKHYVHLITTSPVRRRFEPFDFSETIDLYLDKLDQLANEAVAAAPSPFQAWLLRRLDGQREQGFWLDEFPLYVGAEWCEALGISALHHPKVQSSRLRQADWAAAADEGFRISSGAKRTIENLLLRLNDAQKDTRGFWGPRDTYGYAYKLLENTKGDAEFEPIRNIVREFAISSIPIESGTDVLGTIVDKPAVLTVRSAARFSGAHDRSIRRFFERQGIGQEALESGQRNHRVTVAADQIIDVVEKLKGAFSTPQVLKRTGIPRIHLNALLQIGALPTVTGSERHAHAKHRFAPADVDAAMEKLFAGAVEVHDPLPRQMPVLEARQAACASLKQILSWTLDGTLTWKGRIAGRTDYGALLLDADEATALVRQEPPMVNFTRGEAMEFIPGLNRWALDTFLEKELLSPGMEFSPDARREVPVITRKSAELLRKNFVTLGELCQTSGLHLKQVKLLLKGVGIEPAYNPQDFKVWIYDRRAIDQVLQERPNFWKYDKAKAVAAAY